MNYSSMLPGNCAIGFGAVCLTQSASSAYKPYVLRKMIEEHGVERALIRYKLLFGVVPIVLGLLLLIGATFQR